MDLQPLEPEEIVTQILDKARAHGLSALTAEERTVHRVYVFLFELDMGLLSGFLYNVSPSKAEHRDWTALEQTIQALETLQEHRAAALLTRALRIVSAEIPAEDGTWADFLAAVDPDETLDEIDSELGESSEPLWARLYSAASALPVKR